MLLLSSCGDTEYRSLLDDLTNGDDETQFEAAVELGNRKEVLAVEALTHIIEDDDPFVREACAWALGEIGDPAALEALSNAALNDEEAAVRESAVYSLGAIGDAAAIDTLILVLAGGEAPNVTAFEAGQEPNAAMLAAFSLRKIGAPAIEPLIPGLQDKDVAVRRVVVATLGEITMDTGDGRAIPSLVTMLSDSETIVRETAAHALIIAGDPTTVENLLQVLDAAGSERMAALFLNSGQEQLAAAASVWINARGLDADTVRCLVNGKAKWGRFDTAAVLEGCEES
jgi:HEAT repeat protein